MSESKVIIALIGKSGSGKTTITDTLSCDYGCKVLKSYTTRPRRHPNDDDHIYVSDEEFDKLTDIVAFTEFSGYRYCATQQQVDESDIYIIDPYGLEQLKSLYKGEKRIVSIYVDVPMEICLERMRNRCDSEELCWERLRHDEQAFRGIKNKVDYVVNGIPYGVCLDVNYLINNIKKGRGWR